MIEYLTSAEWFLFGLICGAVVALASVALCAAAVLPDMVVRVRRRHRGQT